MADSGSVTQINASYLNTLKGQLNDILTDVEAQIRGIGTSTDTSTTQFIPAVTSTIAADLKAGASGFDAATQITNALNAMGGSVHDQLVWLEKLLNDMINEITTTVNSFTNTESINNETVDQLMSDFQNTIADMNTPAGSGTTTH